GHHSKKVSRVVADAFGLVRVWQLDTKAKSEGGRDARFVSQLELHPEPRVPHVVCITRIRAKPERNRRRPSPVDRKKVLNSPFDLKLDVGSHSKTQFGVGELCQISV